MAIFSAKGRLALSPNTSMGNFLASLWHGNDLDQQLPERRRPDDQNPNVRTPAMTDASPASGLFTDLYELSMMQAYVEEGMDDQAVFSLTVRRLPATRNYLLACGIDTVLDYLETCASQPTISPTLLTRAVLAAVPRLAGRLQVQRGRLCRGGGHAGVRK
jgi:hypothetical protein